MKLAQFKTEVRKDHYMYQPNHLARTDLSMPLNRWILRKAFVRASLVCGSLALSIRAKAIDLQGDECAPPLDGLVSWWGGDEDATDLQGNNSGKLMKGATYAPGFVSRAAFSFDGIDD